jgi:hypothetical protein
MKINPLNEPLNRNPEGIIELSKEELFGVVYRILLLKEKTHLSDNEVKVLSSLSAGKTLEDTGIKLSNLPPVLKKLNEKGFLLGKELSELTLSYKKAFQEGVEIVMNLKTVNDGSG